MKKTILMMSFVVCILSAMLLPAHAQTVGVAVGDYFLYEGYAELVDQVGSSFALPNWLVPWTSTWGNTDQVNRTVDSIDGTIVWFNVTTTYNNGTAPTSSLENETISESLNRWLIEPNMEVGGKIGELGSTGADLLLSEDSVWTWDTGVERDIVSAGWLNDQSGSYYCTYKNHYDKATGILVSQEVMLTAYSGSDSVTYEVYNVLVETNRWTIPEFPTGTVMLLMFVGVSVSIDIYRRKKLN